MNSEVWNGLQSSDIGLLSLLLLWITRPRLHQRGEISDAIDGELRQQQTYELA